MTEHLVSGGLTLASTLRTPSRPTGQGVLFVHGWRSSQHSPLHYVDRLAALGFTSFAFDLPGMGDSEGSTEELTSKDFLESTIAAYDALAELVDSVAVVGSSFGAYLSARLIAHRTVSKLVLRVPADFAIPDDEEAGQLGAAIDGRVNGGFAKALDTEDLLTEPQVALRSFDGPVLIVESELDDLVLPQTVQRYRQSVPHHQYQLMEGFLHSLQSDVEHDAFGKLVADFLTA